MLSAPIVIAVVGLSLAVLLVERFLWNGYARRFPFFALYALYTGVHMVFIAFILDKLSIPLYNWTFWISSSAGITLRFALVWEVVRHLFPRESRLRPMVSALSLVFLLGLAAAYWGMGPEGYVFSDLERRLSLATAAWLAFVASVAVFHSAGSDRPTFAMALGLGISSSLYLMNFAVYGLSPAFVTAWGLIRQSSFAIAAAIWTWGFWKPQDPTDNTQAGTANPEAASFWRLQWEKLRSRLGAFKS